MKLKILSLILTVCLLLTMLIGCRQDEQNQVLKVNEVTHSIFYAPFYAAIQLGYFKEKGIEIELTNGGGSDKSMTALITHQADIGFMGPETAVYVYNEGQEDYPKIIAQVTQRDGSFLVGKQADNDFTWEKVRGKSIIGGRSGGMPEMTLEYVLRKNGIVPNKDVTVRTDVSFDLMGGAFASGNDDYVALFEPSASMMELAGEGHIVASIGEGTDFVAYTAMMATQSFIEENPKLIQDFVDALYKGQCFVKDSTPIEIAKAIAPAFPDSDEELIESVVTNYKKINAWKTSPETNQADFEQLINVITGAGIEVEKADYQKIVDNTFANKVK